MVSPSLRRADDSVKIPMIQHGATTHLLLFHKFFERNASYRAIKKLPPLTTKAKPKTAPKAGEADGDDGEDDQTGSGQGLDFDRTPLTEHDLMTGTVIKERLIQILDHPGLTNHLLRDKNLLELLVGPVFGHTDNRDGTSRSPRDTDALSFAISTHWVLLVSSSGCWSVAEG